MNLPKFDMKAAGVGFLKDPTEVLNSDERDWENVLQILIAEANEHCELMIDALNEGDVAGQKKIQAIMVRREKEMSAVQSLLSSFRSHK